MRLVRIDRDEVQYMLNGADINQIDLSDSDYLQQEFAPALAGQTIDASFAMSSFTKVRSARACGELCFGYAIDEFWCPDTTALKVCVCRAMTWNSNNGDCTIFGNGISLTDRRAAAQSSSLYIASHDPK